VLALTPSPQFLDAARANARAVSDQHGFDEERSGDLAVVVSELVGNALRHARPPVHFDLLVDGDEIVVVVEDADLREPDDGTACASPDQEGGRGMFLVSVLSRSWGWTPLPGGKRVWARV